MCQAGIWGPKKDLNLTCQGLRTLTLGKVSCLLPKAAADPKQEDRLLDNIVSRTPDHGQPPARTCCTSKMCLELTPGTPGRLRQICLSNKFQTIRS